jgi:hypothetical protein
LRDIYLYFTLFIENFMQFAAFLYSLVLSQFVGVVINDFFVICHLAFKDLLFGCLWLLSNLGPLLLLPL